MYQFLESICFHSNTYHLLDYHQDRIDRTFREFYPKTPSFKLKRILPSLSGVNKIKVRLKYNELAHEISFDPYTPKPITQLRAVVSDSLDYPYKFLDRSIFNQLLTSCLENEDVIIVKKGDVTDSTYSNLIFKQKDVWYTPSTYLLNGVKRQDLLDRKLIMEKAIQPDVFSEFTEVGLINAMLDPGDLTLPVEKIIF